MAKRTRPKSAKAPVEADNISSSIIQLVHEAVIVVDEDQNIILFNQGAEKIFGYKASEALGQRLDLLLPPHVSDSHVAYVRSFAKAPETARVMSERREISGRRKNGTIFPAEASIAKVSSAGKIFLTAILRDITERKLVEQALRESEKKQSMLLNGVDEIIYQVNYPLGGSGHTHGTVEFVSEHTQKILGYRPAEFFADPNLWFNLIHPDDIATILAQTTRIMKTGQPGLRSYRIKDINGDYHWMEDRVSPEKDKTGRVVRTFGVARDITERKQAEATLHESEKRFRALFENASDAVALVGANGTILYESPALTRVLGYAVEERTGRAFFELVHPDDLSDIAHRFAQLLQQPAVTVDAQFRYRHKDGSWRWLEGTGQNLLAEPGVRAIVANYRDITERKRAEESLRESEERYRNLVELSPDMIVVHSEGKIVFINPAGVDFLGAADPQQLIGRPLLDLVHPDFRRTLAERLEPIYKGTERRSQIETRFVRLDGQVMDMEVSSVPITYEGKAARQVITRDISERKRVEERLVYQSQLLTNVHDAIIATDEHYTLTEWNRAAEQLYGWKAEDAIGRMVNEVIPTESTDAQFAEALRLLSETGRYRVEVVQYRRDGKPIDVEGTTMALRDAKGQITGYVSVNRDITERKRAEESLRESEERLRVGLNTANIAVFNQDTDLRYIWMYQPQLGYVSEQVVGHTDAELLPLEAAKQVMEIKRRVFEGGLRERAEVPVSVGGQTFVYDLVAEPLRDVSGAIIGLTGASLDITERKRAEEERMQLYEQANTSRKRLQILSQQLIEAQEVERRHIARELHDEIGQVLTAVRVNLQTIQLSPDPSTLDARLEEGISIVEYALRQVRDLSLDLRPSLLDDFGLVPALEWYVDRQAERSGFTAEFFAEPPEMQLSPVLETACFRIAQAALTNVTRHALAKRVRVELHCTETELRLFVRDDGIGFDVDTVLEHAAQGASFGLLGMRERAQLAGGQIEIESAPMNGTEIRVRFPLLPFVEDGSSEGA